MDKIAFVVTSALVVGGCSGTSSATSSSQGGAGGNTSTSSTMTTATSAATTTTAGQTGQTTGATTSVTTGSGMLGTITCSAPSTAWQQNGSTCGTWRWAPKTGTDNQVSQINMVPEEMTIPQLIAISTATGSTCGRTATELKTYVLRNVGIKFEALEADGDYHLVASDPQTGKTMVTEIPYPGCVGHLSCQSAKPLYCDITHARAAVDAKNPTQAYGSMGVGTIVGVGFFDTDELMMTPGPAGEAPNGIELHPILAICFGQDCNPVAGY